MKIKEYLIDNYLLNPEDKINLFFFIGPDTGLTDQRGKTLSKAFSSASINFPAHEGKYFAKPVVLAWAL